MSSPVPKTLIKKTKISGIEKWGWKALSSANADELNTSNSKTKIYFISLVHFKALL